MSGASSCPIANHGRRPIIAYRGQYKKFPPTSNAYNNQVIRFTLFIRAKNTLYSYHSNMQETNFPL
jgi:hypothetical protein